MGEMEGGWMGDEWGRWKGGGWGMDGGWMGDGRGCLRCTERRCIDVELLARLPLASNLNTNSY